jgi:hypothetical protein
MFRSITVTPPSLRGSRHQNRMVFADAMKKIHRENDVWEMSIVLWTRQKTK